MATPVSETIIADIITALEGVTIPAGYNNTLAWVGRFNNRDPDKGPQALRPYAEVKYGGSTDGPPKQYAISETARVLVKAAIKYDPHDDDGPDVQANRLGFDIRAAILGMGLAAKGYFLDGMQSDPFSELDEENPEDGVLVAVDFHWAANATELQTISPE